MLISSLKLNESNISKGQGFLTSNLRSLCTLIYAFLGYASQGKAFNWKKFLRTVAIGTFSALGLDLTGMTFDVYTALVGATPYCLAAEIDRYR
jgi:hypothetical protein